MTNEDPFLTFWQATPREQRKRLTAAETQLAFMIGSVGEIDTETTFMRRLAGVAVALGASVNMQAIEEAHTTAPISATARRGDLSRLLMYWTATSSVMEMQRLPAPVSLNQNFQTLLSYFPYGSVRSQT